MEDAILVARQEGEESIELDLEDNATLLLAYLKAQFGPQVSGLQYRNPVSDK